MRINTNITAMNTYTQYTSNNKKIADSVSKLSSGYAINTAADNAAGLAISEKMRAQIRGLEKSSANAQDAISLVQTAEGALSSSTEILQRMRELAVQSASDTNNDDIDRTALQDEFEQLQSELDEIATSTSFNKKNLLDGSLSTSKDSITDLDLANSTLGVSTGKVAAGNYTFTAAVKTVTAAITGTNAAATTSTTNSSYNYIDTDTADAPVTVGNGTAFTTTSQYNGNYTLSSKINDDGSMTVTAKGDNDQTFTATITAATLEADIAAAADITLNFGGTNDGFTTTLTLENGYVDSATAKQALADDISGVAISISEGVDQKDATYAAYGTVNGGESVKLAVGDTSATFSNGVTVSFEKLNAADLTVTDGTLTQGIVDKLGATGDALTANVTTASEFTVTKSANAGLTFQVGANEGDSMTINVDRMDAEFLGVNSAKVSTQESAATAIAAVDSAINEVSAQRANLGSIQNRLEYKINNLDTSTENLTSAESQIRDVDMAKQMTEFTNANILSQAATAMLAQANSLPQGVLSLIGG